ncbi:MAG: Cna B-type domain-containing protein, partial [Firmicutes bacterium]|nr:Cna B-type domain-containing protein [Bacillota bacterium]
DTYPIRKYLLLKNTEITIPECIYANPDPEGSFFEGWEAGGTTYLADQKYKVTGDVTFKAKWGTDMHTPLRVVWYDADDKDKIRAESLQIELRGQTDPVTISAEDGWIAMLTGDIDQVKPIWPERIIPSSNAPQGRDKAGQYRYEVEGNLGTGFTIRLYHTPKDTVPVSGVVTWEDGDNKEGDRPDNVTLRLYADGKEQQDITVTASGNWKWDLGKLPEYKDGREISYTLTEDSIDKYIDEVNGLNVTNTHAVDSRHVSVTGQIVWNDDEDALKRRPDKVTLHLKKNGKEIASKVVEPDQEGYWFWNFYVVAGKNEDPASAVFSVTQDDLIDYDTATKTDEDYGYLVVVNTYNAHTHQPAEAVKENETAATCEDDGSYDSVVYCTICGEEISREKIIVPTLGHNWGKWTSEDDIHHKRICANDSTHVQTVEHDFDDGVVTKEATGTSTGIMTYTCEECGYLRNEIIPRKGSDPDQKGTDGTAVGPGASYASAERAVLSMKNDKDPAGTVFSKLRFRSTVQKKKSIRLRWNKPKSARLFVVYGNRCGKKYRMKKLKTLTGTTLNVKKIGGKNLKKGTSYKFIIIALDKDYNVVSTSKVIHGATKGGRLTNYKSVKTSKKSKTLFIRKGRHAWIIGSGVKESRLLRVSIHRGIRYESSNTAIAAVSRIGRVEARKRGVCYYYAYVQNGMYRRIKIMVI